MSTNIPVEFDCGVCGSKVAADRDVLIEMTEDDLMRVAQACPVCTSVHELFLKTQTVKKPDGNYDAVVVDGQGSLEFKLRSRASPSQ